MVKDFFAANLGKRTAHWAGSPLPISYSEHVESIFTKIISVCIDLVKLALSSCKLTASQWQPSCHLDKKFMRF